MANDIQSYQQPSMPALPSALSDRAISEALAGRVDQLRLKRAIEDLVQPHFYDNSEEKLRAVAVMVKDLAEFSDDVAGWAVREWRLKHNARKPSTATLRQLCMVRRHELGREAARRSPVETPAPYQTDTLSDEEKAHRKAVVARVSVSMGMVQTKTGQWTLPSEEKEAERVPHWSEIAAPNDSRWAEVRRARAAARTGA
jgi:hypothetical protein